MGRTDEAMAIADLGSARLSLGIDQGRWSEPKVEWPSLTITVFARPSDSDRIGYTFRIDLTGYPMSAPAGRLWDPETDSPLAEERWPTGPRSSIIFNPRWRVGGVYHPMDRLAQPGHESWKRQNARSWWNSGHTIVDYLLMLTSTLNDGASHAA